MARMETIVKQIKPSLENALIGEMAKFGWEVYSTQEVANSYQERRGDDLYSVNEKYVKITFQRDKDRAGYSEISEIEREYNSWIGKTSSPSYPLKKGMNKITLVVGIAASIIGLIIALVGLFGDTTDPSIPGLGGMMFGVGLIILLVTIVIAKKNKKLDAVKYENYQKRCEEAKIAKAHIEEIEEKLKNINF